MLSRIDEKDLTRKLPELPPGVRYRSVTVDPAGFLTASTKGSHQDTRIRWYARPKITGNILDIAPQQIEMFGPRFPADLTYRGVEVTPTGLLIHVEGKDVILAKGALGGGASC
ncbi:hypothetical protein Aph02nite_45950 [Actinoplanes philippinensis]|uniref:Uncharacterized protein n=1 Tax=Actinoplanes philippinensis TaxID=35752 RepID=A0A1I2I887_9ACTN|nr:hypothetical protein [Actinoplanes philippinensis]GIE78645.1 hypothetical protein Aph02nite_45950 [Actinoplanes philippinensis]SFF37086.1 hypothetical protein SAMN05421541_109286 [Actinoplanes philippinensis]